MNKETSTSVSPVFTAEQATTVISNYFNDVEHEVEVNALADILDVRIIYKNFKPKKTVRSEIERLIPNADITKLERIFSPSAYNLAVEILMDTTPQIYIKENDGALHPVNLHALLEEQLYDITITEPSPESHPESNYSIE